MNTTNLSSKTLKAMACKAGALAVAALVVTGMSVTIGSGTAHAQAAATPDTTKKISLTVTQAPIQSVLKTLFGSEGVNYTIDADVQGNVTVDINEVTFDTALHALLRSTNPPLTYDIENGNIYHIKVKATQADAGAGTGTGTAASGDQTTSAEYNLYKIPIDRYDATVIAALIGNGGTIINIPPNYTVQGGGGASNGKSGISGGATGGLSGQNGQGAQGGIGGQTGITGIGGQGGIGGNSGAIGGQSF